MPFLYPYGVSGDEVDRFIEENRVVRDWVGKFGEATGRANAETLCRFFKWLRMVEGVKVSPRELLDEQILLRRSSSIEDRRRHLRWALDFTRDNPDFVDLSDRRKYGLFIVIKGFYDFHEVPLTTAKRVYGRVSKRKSNRKQITLAEAKEILGSLPQRERTILIIILQSGMEIGAVLNKFNYMWDRVKAQLDAGRPRVKVMFEERKGNNFPYFTYFSADAIHELKKWLIHRQRILDNLVERGRPVSEDVLGMRPIFITRDGGPYTENNYYTIIEYYRRKGRVRNFVTHQFRKLFKTEASLPERGIDRRVVEFMMGHVNSIGSMGGIYDKTPEIHEEVIEREYAKLEPFINIYSGRTPPRDLPTSSEEINNLKRQLAEQQQTVRNLERALVDIERMFRHSLARKS